jgi:hypothetical protein
LFGSWENAGNRERKWFFFFFVLCLVSEKNEIMGLILGIEKVMNGGSAEKKSFIEFRFS